MSKIVAGVGVAFWASAETGGTWELYTVEIPAVASELVAFNAMEEAKRMLEKEGRNDAAGFFLHYWKLVN